MNRQHVQVEMVCPHCFKDIVFETSVSIDEDGFAEFGEVPINCDECGYMVQFDCETEALREAKHQREIHEEQAP